MASPPIEDLGARLRAAAVRVFVDPLVPVTSPDAWRRVRLLAAGTLACALLTGIGGLQLAVFAPARVSGVVVPILLAGGIGYALAHGLARRAHATASAMVFVSTQLLVPTIVGSSLGPEGTDPMVIAAWLSLGVLMASALLGWRLVLGVAAATVLAWIGLAVRHGVPAPAIGQPLLFLGGAILLIVIVFQHRDGLEGDRQVLLRARDAELEAALARLAEQAEAERKREVAARVASSEREQSQRELDARREYIASLSHELRTPLNAVVGFFELLGVSSLAGAQQMHVAGARTAAHHMLELINDVLDHAKIESGRLELESAPFSLEVTVRQAVTVVARAAEEKGLTIDVDLAPELPTWVAGDALRVRQVVVNLLGNAIKFTREGGVRVRARLGAGVSEIRIDVEDDGPGIPAVKLPRIFEAYRQADSTTARRFGGTGLGLAISRRLARAMGGELTIDSTEGNGSTFHFDAVLPKAEAAAVPTRFSMLAPSGGTERWLHVLLADDDPANRLVGKQLLEVLGHRVDVVGDGQAAVTAAESVPYDLIIMDVELPQLDGLAATRLIRATGNHAPILAFTAHASTAHAASCKEAGMTGVIHKPIDLERLAAAVEHVTKRDRSGGVRRSAPKGQRPRPAPVDRIERVRQERERAGALARSSEDPGSGATSTGPMLDLDQFVRRCGGDRVLFAEVLVAVVGEAHRLAGELSAAAEAGRLPEVRVAAHTLRGCVANVGAAGLVSLLSPLEDAAAAGDLARARAMTPPALACFELLHVELTHAVEATRTAA